MQKHIGSLIRVACLALLLAGFPNRSVAAMDTGPKPEMFFTFEFDGDPIEIISGQLMQCDDEACTESHPLEDLGPQHFACTATECESMAYDYADYQKLVIEFTDGTRESNVFTKEHFTAWYTVRVKADSLEVSEARGKQRGFITNFCPALPFTVGVEVLVAVLYLSLFHLPKAGAGWAAAGSLLTLPFVWLLFPSLALPAPLVTGLSEGFAVVVEAGLLFIAFGRSISLKHAVFLSIMMNAASFLLGSLVF